MNKRRGLTREQEDGRIQGLRLLARIIARHYLAHPELYPAPAGDNDGGADGVGGFKGIGNGSPRVSAAGRTGRDAARKEANQ